MRRWFRLTPFAALLLLLHAGRLAAQPPDDEEEDEAAEAADDEEKPLEEPAALDAEGIPSGYRKFEIVDVTTGMRDDTFWTVEVGTDGTIYVGTMEGRSYISKDNGTTWSESWVLPEMKSLYAFVGQTMLLGKTRSDNAHRAVLLPVRTSLQSLFTKPGTGGVGLGSGLPNLEQKVAPVSGVRWTPADPLPEQLVYQAQTAALDPGVVLGAALSVRAPRLSILLGVRGRPIPNISLQRLLLDRAQRITEVRRLIPDPKNQQHIFAATWYGLYQSYDGGVSWVRTYAGLTPADRGVYDIVFDPTDPKRVYMGTQRGLFISDNNGDGWKKSTIVPEILVKKIAIDPRDPKRIYVAGLGGVFRSADRLQSIQLAYFSGIPRWNDVFWISIDPNDPDTAYLGTGAGLVKTEKLSTSTVRDWHFLKPLRLENLVTQWVYTCPKHKGHLYTGTRADLTAINYGSNGPDSYILESWNAGEDWRVLASMRTAGDLRWFTVDPRDPDEVWVAFSRSLHHVRRLPDDAKARPVKLGAQVFPGDPSLTQVLEAALEYHKLGVGTYQNMLDKLRYGNWLPSRLNVQFDIGRSRAGATQDDIQFADDRYRVGAAVSRVANHGLRHLAPAGHLVRAQVGRDAAHPRADDERRGPQPDLHRRPAQLRRAPAAQGATGGRAPDPHQAGPLHARRRARAHGAARDDGRPHLGRLPHEVEEAEAEAQAGEVIHAATSIAHSPHDHGARASLGARGAHADDEVDRFLRRFDNEPTIREVQLAAIKYYNVSPERISSLRSRTRSKALVPGLSIGVTNSLSSFHLAVDDIIFRNRGIARFEDQNADFLGFSASRLVEPRPPGVQRRGARRHVAHRHPGRHPARGDGALLRAAPPADRARAQPADHARGAAVGPAAPRGADRSARRVHRRLLLARDREAQQAARPLTADGVSSISRW